MTFYRWLVLQKDRDDPIGDFARDAMEDKSRPQSSALRAWQIHLRVLPNVSDLAREALRDAHAEYRQFEQWRTNKGASN